MPFTKQRRFGVHVPSAARLQRRSNWSSRALPNKADDSLTLPATIESVDADNYDRYRASMGHIPAAAR